MKSKHGICLLAFSLLSAMGCHNELETGYEPRALNSSSAVRRGYYASPFTPEAKAAAADRDQIQDVGSRRPKPGY